MSMLNEMLQFEIDGRFFYVGHGTELRVDASGRTYLAIYEEAILNILEKHKLLESLESYCFACKFLSNALESHILDVFSWHSYSDIALYEAEAINDWTKAVSAYGRFKRTNKAFRDDLVQLAWRIYKEYATDLRVYGITEATETRPNGWSHV